MSYCWCNSGPDIGWNLRQRAPRRLTWKEHATGHVPCAFPLPYSASPFRSRASECCDLSRKYVEQSSLVLHRQRAVAVGRSNGAACIMQRRMGPRAKNDLIITKRLRQKAPGSLAPLAQNPFSVGVVDEMRSDPDSPTRFQPGQPCSHLGRAG